MDKPSDKKKFYLTTPIYYANSRPHVGSAYTTIVCDVIARYKRMCGYEVAYLTGTDEHGVNIERAAEKAGVSPAELVERNQKIFLELWKLLGIQYTHFIRTTSPQHARAVQNLVRRTRRHSPDAIYKGKYEGRYCIYDNLYVSDTTEPADCPTCGRPAELVSEENYFFRLSAYQKPLLELYAKNRHFVHPDFRFNEVKSFVESGLRDLSISRKSIKWGIPWPDDEEHVFYVWYDALTSYISGIGFVDGEHDGPDFRYWPADIHAMGKEIIRFHAVYWPAFLMAAGVPLPKQIVAHGWLLFEQEKMSKSKGNVAYPEPIVKVLGNDALRYYLLREVVFGQDGNFSRDALLTRYNADLANGLGNLASRVLTMIEKYCGGAIPDSTDRFDRLIKEIADPISSDNPAWAGARAYFDKFDFSRALEAIWTLVSAVDARLTTVKPWALAEDVNKREALTEILYSAAEALRIVTILAHPIIPDATQKIWEQLGQEGKLGNVRIELAQWGGLKPGTRIGKPEGVFPRVDKEEASERIAKMEDEIRNPGSTQPAAPATPSAGATATGGAAAAAAPAPGAKISIEDFAKVEMRVGIVKSAEKVAGADRLLKVMVDIGDEVRQVLAGIAQYYVPEDLVGRKVVVVVNLAPRKMRGQESNGMIVAASVGPEGRPVLATFTEDVPAGAKLK
ncbi:MAG TPA: methionine--tRNA ligase [Candidatus Limnocylindrales bacterium]|nr:methionine--tRNA ligase [Candidatus Limnocylindrales bacterium]